MWIWERQAGELQRRGGLVPEDDDNLCLASPSSASLFQPGLEGPNGRQYWPKVVRLASH
jgi:hypothetical protein